MFKKKLGQRGFTLIELLVVIAIIGILSSVVLVSLNTSRAKARDAKRIADIGQIQQALALYYDSNGFYPQTLAALSPEFIAVTPVGPSTESYAYATVSATPASNLSYHLGATLEQVTTGGVIAADRDCTSAAAGCFEDAAAAGGFAGADVASTPCQTGTGVPTGTDIRCYDVTP